MIQATGLTKRYDDLTAVKEVELSIEQGTVYGFLGPNGAGKTTTIEMLTAMTEPTGGTATVAGIDITDRDALKQHIGYLPDEPPLYDAFSAREQLEYVAVLRGMDARRAGDRIDTLLEHVDLAADADREIKTYSTGMRQKVGLLQSLLHRPEVLFLDEPTSGLDPRAARDVVTLIDDLADSGTTVFLSTHILPVVEELADVIGVLYEGRLVAEGSPADLISRATTGNDGSLEEAFLQVTSDSAAVASQNENEHVPNGGQPGPGRGAESS